MPYITVNQRVTINCALHSLIGGPGFASPGRRGGQLPKPAKMSVPKVSVTIWETSAGSLSALVRARSRISAGVIPFDKATMTAPIAIANRFSKIREMRWRIMVMAVAPLFSRGRGCIRPR